ncbi:hypothetical protein BCCR75502_03780 [Burkholderia sola]|nr:hypothetical protein BCCR75389_03765 [Burkholderia cenocepacia]CAG2314530.1 hypothetical protein BCCR75384_03780 [Burkholderia cenocepacia]CAG2314610.1 hypothetical protein BCCR75386_03781 [Burkholderia cenocepacia]CAG2314620.1 hypothetical protein BCCR12632_03783 [Burkholderia cenocepacia]CAG2314622.1 hypothetical protein BCCR75387_03780 [Burkholderia cenocepacia]
MMGALKTLGPDATVSELLGATTKLVMLIAFATLWGNNTRLRKLLEQNGIDPTRRKR